MFEVITESEFKGSGVPTLEVAEVVRDGDLATGTPDKTYCEFCKEWYYDEYHYGREVDDESGR